MTEVSAFTLITDPESTDYAFGADSLLGAGDEVRMVWANVSKALIAANIPNVPAGGISATDIQAALDELDGEKQSNISGLGLTDAGTPASDDKILLQDTSDSNNLKYAAFSEFGGGGGQPFQFQAVREVTSTGNITNTDNGDLVSASGTFTLTLLSASFTVGQFVGVVNKGTGVITVSVGTEGINRAGTDSLTLEQDQMIVIVLASTSVDPKWRSEIPSSLTGTAAQMIVVDSGGDSAFVTLTGAVAVTDAGVTTVEDMTFDRQFVIDVTTGNADYVIHDDSGFAYTIDSVNALQTDIGTLTAGVEINTTAVTGISVAVTTTKQTVADASTALDSVVATDEVSIAVTSVASSPTLLTGVLHCTRTLT